MRVASFYSTMDQFIPGMNSYDSSNQTPQPIIIPQLNLDSLDGGQEPQLEPLFNPPSTTPAKDNRPHEHEKIGFLRTPFGDFTTDMNQTKDVPIISGMEFQGRNQAYFNPQDFRNINPFDLDPCYFRTSTPFSIVAIKEDTRGSTINPQEYGNPLTAEEIDAPMPTIPDEESDHEIGRLEKLVFSDDWYNKPSSPSTQKVNMSGLQEDLGTKTPDTQDLAKTEPSVSRSRPRNIRTKLESLSPKSVDCDDRVQRFTFCAADLPLSKSRMTLQEEFGESLVEKLEQDKTKQEFESRKRWKNKPLESRSRKPDTELLAKVNRYRKLFRHYQIKYKQFFKYSSHLKAKLDRQREKHLEEITKTREFVRNVALDKLYKKWDQEIKGIKPHVTRIQQTIDALHEFIEKTFNFPNRKDAAARKLFGIPFGPQQPSSLPSPIGIGPLECTSRSSSSKPQYYTLSSPVLSTPLPNVDPWTHVLKPTERTTESIPQHSVNKSHEKDKLDNIAKKIIRKEQNASSKKYVEMIKNRKNGIRKNFTTILGKSVQESASRTFPITKKVALSPKPCSSSYNVSPLSSKERPVKKITQEFETINPSKIGRVYGKRTCKNHSGEAGQLS